MRINGELSRAPKAGTGRAWYDRDIDWFLNCSASVLGLHSSHSAVVAVLERGGGQNYTVSPEWHGDEREVARARRLRRVWGLLDDDAKEVLWWAYCGSMPVVVAGQRHKWPLGVSAHIPDPPGPVLLAAHRAGKLAEVLQALTEGNVHAEAIESAKTQADEDQSRAHRSWNAAIVRLYRE